MALHMSTIISRRTVDILTHIAELRATGSVSSAPLLYAISVSQHTSSSDMTQLTAAVKSLSSESVGCFSASIPSARSAWQHYTAVSLASFDSQRATLFRSTIPGRKAIQVGRWHAPNRKEKQPERDYSQDIDLNWESKTPRSNRDPLPPAIQHFHPEDVESVVYLSDNAPEGLNRALSRFSYATKLGMTATSTPFVTGRPYTLFHNDSVYSDGAVGVCLSPPARSIPYSDFPGLEAITQTLTVTSTEGNLVNALDGSNPSRLLLQAIERHPSVSSHAKGNIPKELQLYMGTFKQSGNPGGQLKLEQLFHINSGDPSRGSIALDTDVAPAEGSTVKLFLLSPYAKVDVLGEVQARSAAQRSLIFATTSLDDLNETASNVQNPSRADTVFLPDVFLAATENGCMISRIMTSDGISTSEPTWKCTVPGSLMGLQWDT